MKNVRNGECARQSGIEVNAGKNSFAAKIAQIIRVVLMPRVYKKKEKIKKTLKKIKAKAKKPPKLKALLKISSVTAEESKYYSGVEVVPQEFKEKSLELPAGYGDNRVVLMVRDPFCIFTYWETFQSENERILRVYETLNWNHFDIEVTGNTRNWYIKVPLAGKTYCVEIGYIDANGKFIALARSNFVTTPPDGPSDIIDEEWMTLEWEKLYKIARYDISSGAVFSFSNPSGR